MTFCLVTHVTTNFLWFAVNQFSFFDGDMWLVTNTYVHRYIGVDTDNIISDTVINTIGIDINNQYSASDWKSSTKNEWAFREERFVEF